MNFKKSAISAGKAILNAGKKAATSVGKVVLNAGVVFSIANVLAFIPSGNFWAVLAAVRATAMTGTVSCANAYPKSRLATFLRR